MPNEFIELWPAGAPGALGNGPEDRPSLELYLLPGPDARPCMLVLPGGGYGGHALEHEGQAIAHWCNALGISAVVLRYRLGPKYHHPCMLDDANRAMRVLRHNAAAWEIDPARIAVIGFSAGGHLVSTLGTHWDGGDAAAADPIDRHSSRPNLLVLCYPVISMLPHDVTHGGSRENLLGPNPAPELMNLLSNQLHVNAQTPPTFILHTADDEAVPVENAYLFASALARAGVNHELHVYAHGPHGVGLARGKWHKPLLDTWTNHLTDWLRGHGFSV
jgi:acetyl esterase/lipase